MTPWLDAIRPRTLPLALSSTVLGTLLAAGDGVARWPVAVLASLTAVLLQVLSNLANDYGDSVHGADQAGRIGPARAVQSGLVSRRAMRRAVLVCAALALSCGLALLGQALGTGRRGAFLLFVALGLAAILAAVLYTAGPRPYGYAGLGDAAVLLFFGWVAVLGSYVLQAQAWRWAPVLPATSAGLLAVAVLNANNLRDIESDGRVGKRTLAVRLGWRWARWYHVALLGAAVLAALLFVLLGPRGLPRLAFLAALPWIVANARAVLYAPGPAALQPVLRQAVGITVGFCVLFGVGHLVASVVE